MCRGGRWWQEQQRCITKLEQDQSPTRMASQIDRLFASNAAAASRQAYAELLRDCSDTRALPEGRRLHAHLTSIGYHHDRLLANLLMRMYGKCGLAAEARLVFDDLPRKNSHSWNILIVAYAQNGRLQESRAVLQKMAQFDVVSWTSIFTGYAQAGEFIQARVIFDAIPVRDVAAWNAMIAVYAQRGHCRDAVKLYRQMLSEGIKPDQFTIVAVVDACGSPSAASHGRSIHDGIRRTELELDVVSSTAVLNMYARCSQLELARQVFDEMGSRRSIVSWTSMVNAYAVNGHMDSARCLFDDMPSRNVVTWNAILGGYAQFGQLEQAIAVFERMPLRDIISWNASVSAYARNGHLLEAKQMFNRTPLKNAVSWNSIIAAFSQASEGKEALAFFKRMDSEGVQANEVTFVCGLDACANVVALEEGKSIHEDILHHHLEGGLPVQNALLNMYAKCGSLALARSLFDRLLHRDDTVVWSSMISAYSQTGHPLEALDLFKLMLLHGICPNDMTFISILAACSHAGLTHDGLRYFVSMNEDFGMSPAMQHYVCVVDILGRSGHTEQGQDLVLSMPYEPGDIAWMTLLGACRLHGSHATIAARAAAECAFEMDTAAPYVLLSHVHKGCN